MYLQVSFVIEIRSREPRFVGRAFSPLCCAYCIVYNFCNLLFFFTDHTNRINVTYKMQFMQLYKLYNYTHMAHYITYIEPIEIDLILFTMTIYIIIQVHRRPRTFYGSINRDRLVRTRELVHSLSLHNNNENSK